MVCVNVRTYPHTPPCPRLHPLAHYAYFAHVRVCGCAKFRTFALLHTFFSKKIQINSAQHTCTHIAHISHACGRAKFRTSAILHTFFSKNFKLTPPNTLARTSHTLRTRADVRNFARSHFCTHICNNLSRKYQWPHLHPHRTHFACMWVCEILHISIFAHIFYNFLYCECMCANLQNFSNFAFLLTFLKTNSSGHTCMHIEHILLKCYCTKFHTSTLLHTNSQCQSAYKLNTFHTCENVWNFAHLHTFLQFTLLMSKDFPLQPQAHPTYSPHLLVCKCVNVQNFPH